MKRKFITICLALLVLVFSLSACSLDMFLNFTYSYNDFTFVLPLGFEDDQQLADENGFTFVIDNDIEFFCGTIEDKSYLASEGYEINSLLEYAQAIKYFYGISDSINNYGSYYYMTYDSVIDGIDFTYMTCIFENSESYLVITYYTPSSMFDEDAVHDYMKGITF